MRYAQALWKFNSYKANYRLACRYMRLISRASKTANYGGINSVLAFNAVRQWAMTYNAWQTAPADPEVAAIRQFVASKVG